VRALAPRPRTRRRRVELVRIADVLARALRLSGAQLTTQGALRIIERATGVSYCASSARAILHLLGFSYSREHRWRRIGEPRRPPGVIEPRRRAS
jgi:transposase